MLEFNFIMFTSNLLIVSNQKPKIIDNNTQSNDVTCFQADMVLSYNKWLRERMRLFISKWLRPVFKSSSYLSWQRAHSQSHPKRRSSQAKEFHWSKALVDVESISRLGIEWPGWIGTNQSTHITPKFHLLSCILVAFSSRESRGPCNGEA